MLTSKLTLVTLWNSKYSKYLVTLPALFLFLSIYQDRLNSDFEGQTFYLSESALFNSVYVWFVPVIALQIYFIGIITDRINVSLICILTVSAIIIHILAFSFSIFLLSLILFDHSYTFLKTISYTIGEDMEKYILVYGSFALLYSNQLKVSTTATMLPVSTIIVTSGNKAKIIYVNEIISITASSPYVIIQTSDGSYVYQQTLKIMLAKLANQRFLQIHKSHLINLEKVTSYKSRLNGDYDVVMKNGAELRLSRTYVGPFRQALR